MSHYNIAVLFMLPLLTYCIDQKLMKHDSCKDNVLIEPGALIQEVKSPILYEHTVPLLYRLHKIPRSHIFEVNITYKVEASRSVTGYLTQIHKEVLQLLEKREKGLFDKLGGMKPNHKSYPKFERRISMPDSYWVGKMHIACCDDFQPKQLILSELDHKISMYVDGLVNNLTTPQQKVRIFGEKVTFLSKALKESIYTVRKTLIDMYRAYLSEYSSATTSASWEALNAYLHTGLQYSYIFYTEMIRVYENLNILCLNKRIPPMFVDTETFETDLLNLEHRLLLENLRLSIPLRDIKMYYRLDLVECTENKDYFLYKVSIPVQARRNRWDLFHVRPLPYGNLNETCHMNIQDTFVATTSVSSKQVIVFNPKSKKECNLEGLCRIPTEMSSLLTRSTLCIAAIFQSENASTIVNKCKLTCIKHTDMLVSVTSNFRVSLTNVPEPGVKIKCFKEDDLSVPILAPNIGNILIHLPCKCEIFIGDKRVAAPSYPCRRFDSEVTTVFRSIPLAWASNESLRIASPHGKFNLPVGCGLDDAYNWNWRMADEELQRESLKDEERMVTPSVCNVTCDCNNCDSSIDPKHLVTHHHGNNFFIHILIFIIIVWLLSLTTAIIWIIRGTAIPTNPARADSRINSRVTVNLYQEGSAQSGVLASTSAAAAAVLE